MLRQTRLLVSLVALLDWCPWPPEPAKRPRGRPKTYADRLIMKALVVRMIRRLYTASALLVFLEQDDAVANQLRPLLPEHGRLPTRRPWERRLAALPPHLPGLIGSFGRHLVHRFNPWAHHGRAVAVDSTPLTTSGGVWHKKPKDRGEIPHTSMDTEAGWSKSGWHGWWSGWKWPLAVAVGASWIPLAAELTAAKTAANAIAPLLVEPLPAEVRFVLGDPHDHDPSFRQLCEQSHRLLVATRRGAYPHQDDGVEVRRLFHRLRSQAIEPFNGLCTKVFEWRTQMPVRSLRRSQWVALGAIFSYQLALLSQHKQGAPVGKGIKALLRAA
jgi:hypothetical protein